MWLLWHIRLKLQASSAQNLGNTAWNIFTIVLQETNLGIML